MSADKKVFILGLDGGTFDMILPLVERGDLPHMAKLLKEGAWGELESTIHPSTPIAWTSFMTGVNPGRHGIYDFVISKENEYGFRLTSAADRREETMWDYMSMSGKKVIVVNVPYTYPPDKVNGIMIAGADAPMSRREIATPPEIFDDLVDEFGSYMMDWTFPVGWRYDVKGYQEHLKKTIEFRMKSSIYLMKKYPWDCFAVVFNPIDHVQHIFLDGSEEGRKIIENAYRLFDECLGKFLAEIGKDVVFFMMSDHGAGPIERVFYLDTWLKKEGYYQADSAVLRPKNLLLSAAKKGRTFLRRNLPVSTKKFLRYLFPDIREKVESSISTLNIDWSRVKAYSSGYYGNIYINLKGVRPLGTVEPGDYDKLCEEITNKLCFLEDPETGERVVEKVFRKDEIYSGPYIKFAPDLIVKWKNYSTFTKKGIDDSNGHKIFGKRLMAESSDFPLTGTHRLNGIFMAYGPGIRATGKIKTPHIHDLFPTVLYIMGLSIPDDRNGRIISEIFNRDLLSMSPPRYVSPNSGRGKAGQAQSLTPEGEEAVAERLRSLGYIE